MINLDLDHWSCHHRQLPWLFERGMVSDLAIYLSILRSESSWWTNEMYFILFYVLGYCHRDDIMFCVNVMYNLIGYLILAIRRPSYRLELYFCRLLAKCIETIYGFVL